MSEALLNFLSTYRSELNDHSLLAAPVTHHNHGGRNYAFPLALAAHIQPTKARTLPRKRSVTNSPL